MFISIIRQEAFEKIVHMHMRETVEEIKYAFFYGSNVRTSNFKTDTWFIFITKQIINKRLHFWNADRLVSERTSFMVALFSNEINDTVNLFF